MKCSNAGIFFLVWPFFGVVLCDTIAQKSAVFPYVVASDTEVMHREENIKPEASQMPIVDIGALERMLSHQTPVEQPNHSIPNVINGNAEAMRLLLEGQSERVWAYVRSTSTSDRFGPETGLVVFWMSTVLLLPFLWFLIAGGSNRLFQGFVSLTSGYAVHALLLSVAANLGSSAEPWLTLSLVFGMGGMCAGYYFTNFCWKCVVFLFNLSLLCLLKIFPFIGPNCFIASFLGVNPIVSYYIWLCSFAAVYTILEFRFLKDDRTKRQQPFSTCVISVTSAVVLTGCISSITERLSGKAAPMDYLKFFSPPSSLDIASSLTWYLTATMSVLAVLGAFLHHLRYKQFGLSPKWVAAAASIKDGVGAVESSEEYEGLV